MHRPWLTQTLDRLLNPFQRERGRVFQAALPMTDTRQTRGALAGNSRLHSAASTAQRCTAWFAEGINDPWDHVEAVMGLIVAGHYQAALKGFDRLANNQREDGAWFAAYQNNAVADDTRAETNFVAYVATGLWHYFLATGDAATLHDSGQCLEGHNLRFGPAGAKRRDLLGRRQPNRHVKGRAGDRLQRHIQVPRLRLPLLAPWAKTAAWRYARYRLGDALRNKPECFDRTWESKARYSMDWFYPVLTGVISGDAAKQRLSENGTFVEPGLGCRCVQEQPWVTVAETCELIMACVVAGETSERSRSIKTFSAFNWTTAAGGRVTFSRRCLLAGRETRLVRGRCAAGRRCAV